MAQKEKITKLALKQFVKDSNTYTILYPQTSGDMVVGKVGDSNKLDGKTASYFMPAVCSGYMRVMNEDSVPQGIVCSQLIISSTINDTDKLLSAEKALWVQGRAYIQNGKEVATINDINNAKGELVDNLKNTNVKYSLTTGKLQTPITINDVLFDGSSNIDVKSFVVQPNVPTNTNKLWINPTNNVMSYYYNNKWNPLST